MKRSALVALAATFLVAVLAGPALAKGEGVPVSVKAVINGPGLDRPIVVTGKFWGFGEGPPGAANLADDLTVPSGLGAGPDVGWYELAPDPATLGPGYAVTYTFEANDLFTTSTRLRQIVYPYAPDRPLVYTPPGQRFFGSKIGEWWSAPPSLRTYLTSIGLPAAPVAAPAPARPITLPEVPASEGFPWAIAFASTALLAMVVTAALAGRRAQLRRRA